MALKINKPAPPTNPCSEDCCGVNEAEFLLVNGKETTLYCEPGFENEVVDLLKNGATVAYDSEKDGITTVRVS